MSWCNSACVVFYFGMLSAFEVTREPRRARRCSLLAALLRPKMVLQTTSDSAEAPNSHEWWEWFTRLRNFSLLSSVFCLLFIQPTGLFSRQISSMVQRRMYRNTRFLVQTHMSQRKWEVVKTYLRIVCASTKYMLRSYVGSSLIFTVMSLRVFAITTMLPHCVIRYLKGEWGLFEVTIPSQCITCGVSRSARC